jgi:PAS domain S-box-containing protein
MSEIPTKEQLTRQIKALEKEAPGCKKVEEMLLKTRVNLTDALRLAHAGIWVWNVQTGEVEWSDEVFRMFELDPKEYHPEIDSIMGRFHPDDRRLREELTRRITENREQYTFEARIRSPSGNIRYLLTTSEGDFDDQGRLIGMSGIVIDITDHKKLEETLDESEKRYQTLFESMAQGVVYQSADGRIISANPAALDILGLTLDQTQGRSSVDHRWRSIREDGSEFSGDQHPSMQALALGKPVNEVVMGIFHPVADEYRWILIDAVPEFRHGETRPYQVFTTFTDITERKRAEEAMKRTNHFLRESQKVARLGHYVFDALTGYWESSDVLDEIFGIDANFSKNTEGWLQLVHPDDRNEMAVYLSENVFKLHQPFDREYKIIRAADAQERWVHGRGRLEFDAEGKLLYMIGTIQDISDQKKLKEQLLQAQKMEAIGQLAGGVAHDFNNMLSVILGYAELIKSSLSPEDELFKDVVEIEKAAGHSRDVTRQLLAFSRKQIISPKTVNLNKLIAGTQKTLSRLIGELIDLNFHPGSDLGNIRFDPSQIDQILVNLSVNARDAMPDGGRLTIETTNVDLDEAYCRANIECRPGGYVLLSVSDNGSGMEKETLSHIFEPFFTTKSLGKGTGLGLATVYGIVKQNGGFINVYSEAGRGTTFKIYIPRIMGESSAKEKFGEIPPKAYSGTILLVEDDDMVRGMTSAMLENIGYTVVAAESPLNALAICEKEDTDFDLLITDVVMPQMGGAELRDRIKAVRADIKVLFMSGYTSNVIVHHGVLEEGVHFVQKPFTLKDLAQKARDAIRSQ